MLPRKKLAMDAEEPVEGIKRRPMMLYVEEGVFKAIGKLARAQRPPTRPGPMAAEILRQYFEKEEENHDSKRKR